jgi:hypothetical protein
VLPKEVNKEQPSYRNLLATATRVPQWTCPVAASGKDFQLFTPHLRLYTHKNYNKIFMINKEIQQGSGAKSYVTKYWLYHSPAE